MNFESKDTELRNTIVSALYGRQTINANKDIGVMYLQAEPEDRVNPSVIITKDDIRTHTGREKVRDAVMNEFARALQTPGIVVERLSPDAMKVTVVPQRVRENEFGSLKELQAKNAKELEENPDLGEPMY